MNNNHLIKELQTIIPGSISFDKFWVYRHKGGPTLGNMVNKPGKLDAMAIIICSKGSMEITCNFRKISLEENMVFISRPHNTLSVNAAADCEGYVIATVDSGLTDYTIDPKQIPELLDKAYDSPVITVTGEERVRICTAIDMICDFITSSSDSPFKSSIIKSGLNTFAYVFADMMYSHMPTIEYELKTIKREKEHFNRFMKLLSENYMKEREVGWYADQMNLTPRYLTTTIRKVSGHTVSDWIYRLIIKDAKYLLKHSDMTVQQVAYELNFPNQSFFGKFFKKHTGMSPGSYRNSPDE